MAKYIVTKVLTAEVEAADEYEAEDLAEESFIDMMGGYYSDLSVKLAPDELDKAWTDYTLREVSDLAAHIDATAARMISQ